MEIDVANVEGDGAAAEIKIPHAGKFFASGSDDFVANLLEVIEPAHQRLVIMT